jgi:hypothetical protein
LDCRIRAATPATAGAAMEVPDMVLLEVSSALLALLTLEPAKGKINMEGSK